MSLLRRHIALHVLAGTLLVMAVLLGLFAIAEFAQELGEAPENYPLSHLLSYVAMRLPGILVSNAGFALLIGCLMGLGVMASQSELTVIRASGVSVASIVWMAMRPALLVIMLVSLAAEFMVPGIDRLAGRWRSEQVDAEMPFNLIDSRSGMWLRQGNDFVHFNHVTAAGDIYGFSRIAFDDERSLRYAQYASRASRVSEAGRQGWQLDKVRTTRFVDSAVNTDGGEDTFWASDLDPGLLSVVASEPASMSVRELRYYMEYLDAQLQDKRSFELVFWQKCLQPLAMAGLVLVAISFIFGPLRDRTMGHRLFTGIMVGILFRFSQDLLGPTSMVYGFAPWLAVLLPIVMCWALGFVLLSKTR